MQTADVVVVGAGAVGAACAYFAATQGLTVRVVERGSIAGGTSSACEGNLLVSDKEEGPELDLAVYSRSVFRSDLAEHGARWEFDAKGGLVVAATEPGAAALTGLTARQRRAGIEVVEVDADRLPDYEPELATGLRAVPTTPRRPGPADAAHRGAAATGP